MVSYELAKKLKDAGFPQEGNDFYWVLGDDYDIKNPDYFLTSMAYEYTIGKTNILNEYEYTIYDGYDHHYRIKDHIACPTLSELIEALRDKKKIINGGSNFLIFTENTADWTAGIQWYKDEYLYKNGDSLEEALANLWLELNRE